jgi:DNA polymerase III alpha subunit
MATFKAQGLISKFEQKLITGMIKNGYTEEYAHRVFRQLEGFGSYGFLKVMQQVSHTWYIYPHGSNVITRTFLPAHC